MSSRFPGMNPYLEQPSIWPEVHSGLIGALMRSLNRQITPRYRAAVEKRVYLDVLTVMVPDGTVYETQAAFSDTPTPKDTSRSGVSAPSQLTAATILSEPERVSLPIPEEVTERFLEIREPQSHRVVTVVEILSPKNKRTGEGRTNYLRKRQRILSSTSHFVEIDLLRAGESMPLNRREEKDYEILVSRVQDRPLGDRYGFGKDDPIPCFPLPLDPGEAEPMIDLKKLLEQVYEEAALELEIDYDQPANR